MILMQLNSNKITFLVGNEQIIEEMDRTPALPPFSEQAVNFLADLSRELVKTGRGYSDVATFGFWCRKAAVAQYQKEYTHLSDRLGRGIVFHIAPSNVPVNFAFTLAAGLLAGNANIVRVPSKDFAQVDVICQAIGKLLGEKHSHMAAYMCLVKYDHDQEITDGFSAICHTRVIWGGDQTIYEIRKSPLRPRATEITFADRYSICAIDADEYLKMEDKQKIAQGFYNDTYFSDQNACTSPRLIAWRGREIAKAQEEFWGALEKLVKEQYELAAVQSVGKLSAFCKLAADKQVSLLTDLHDCYLMRIQVPSLEEDTLEYRYNSGFFMEYTMEDFKELLPICTEQCQTLSYLGIEEREIRNFVAQYRPRGIDRIVPMGTTMDFTLVWDGYDLIISLSRKIGGTVSEREAQ